MKSALTIFILLSIALAATAQPKASAPDDQGQSFLDWLNLNDNVIRDLQERFAGTNILELGSLKEAATQALPILQEYDETQPLALWLQTHMEDLKAADEMLREMQQAQAQAGTTNPPSAPPLKLQRRVWVEVLDQQPWPPLARTYVPELKQAFAAEKMPPELVWIAEVESSFDPRARSPAGGAGLFQLKRATARDEKLSLWPFDQRLQPVKSAHAAAKLLRHLHRHYGDWRLALAAYNAGEGEVDHLLKRQGARSFDAIASRLPVETQLYVPKVEATIEKREGRELAELKLPK